jgi:hypothetical protein
VLLRLFSFQVVNVGNYVRILRALLMQLCLLRICPFWTSSHRSVIGEELRHLATYASEWHTVVMERLTRGDMSTIRQNSTDSEGK